MHLTVLALALGAAFQPLHADHAEASSFLKSNWNKYEENYHPNYVLDDDPKTAWVEGKDGDGVGETLTIPLSTLSSARALKLQIRNGYQKSRKLLAANGAPRDVTIVVFDHQGREAARQKATLQATMGSQDIVIDLAGRGVSVVRLTVDSVTPGTVYKDTCISDIKVFVDSDVPWNAPAEQRKKEALATWKKERVETARFFARRPADWPFAATSFVDITEDGFFVADWKDKDGTVLPSIAGGIRTLLAAGHPGLARLDSGDRDDFATLVRWRDGERPPGALTRRVEPAGRRHTLPDGFWLPDGIAPFLDKSQFVMVESATTGGTRRQPIIGPATGEIGDVVFGDAIVDGPLLFLPVTTSIQERTLDVTTVHWLFHYDDAGHLVRAVWTGAKKQTTGFMLENPEPKRFHTATVPGEVFGGLRIVRNAAGKIEELFTLQGGVECGYLGDGTENPADPSDVCRFVLFQTRSVAKEW